jgi:hypothetical protein
MDPIEMDHLFVVLLRTAKNLGITDPYVVVMALRHIREISFRLGEICHLYVDQIERLCQEISLHHHVEAAATIETLMDLHCVMAVTIVIIMGHCLETFMEHFLAVVAIEIWMGLFHLPVMVAIENSMDLPRLAVVSIETSIGLHLATIVTITDHTDHHHLGGKEIEILMVRHHRFDHRLTTEDVIHREGMTNGMDQIDDTIVTGVEGLLKDLQ